MEKRKRKKTDICYLSTKRTHL